MPFAPAGTATIAASTTSANVALAGGETAIVYNASAMPAFLAFGMACVTAAVPTGAAITNGLVVPPGQQMQFKVGAATWAAAILASGTGSVYITTGTGSIFT